MPLFEEYGAFNIFVSVKDLSVVYSCLVEDLSKDD